MCSCITRMRFSCRAVAPVTASVIPCHANPKIRAGLSWTGVDDEDAATFEVATAVRRRAHVITLRAIPARRRLRASRARRRPCFVMIAVGPRGRASG